MAKIAQMRKWKKRPPILRTARIFVGSISNEHKKSSYRTIHLPLLSDSRSREEWHYSGFVFLQFCRFHMCTIQEQSFLYRFLKKIEFSPTGKVVVMQILVSCINSFLVACTRLYIPLFLSIHPSLGWFFSPILILFLTISFFQVI